MARARTANIVSFEEARSARVRTAGGLEGRRGRAGGTDRVGRSNQAGRGYRADRFDSAGEYGRANRTGRSDRAGRTNRADHTGAESRSGRTVNTNGAAATSRFGRAANASRIGRATRVTSAEASANANAEDEQAEPRGQLDARERRRRNRSKARAERMYAKQFEGVDSAPVPEEGAPRAAVYEGKMGSSHRKSTRMQRASTAGPATAKIDPSGWFSSTHITERALKVATGVLCVVLACGFLYVPAQQYYQAQREHDRLQAEYTEIEKRNDVLDVQNDILASDAGLEDAVRQKYGYVKAGEETAVVLGLSDETTDTSRGSENIEANVLSSSVKASEEWYTPFLDAFFGVE